MIYKKKKKINQLQMEENLSLIKGIYQKILNVFNKLKYKKKIKITYNPSNQRKEHIG